MADEFNINSGGNNEKLNKFKQGIKKDQLDEKHKELFNVFDEDNDGQLSKEELSTVDNVLSVSEGDDNVLSKQESDSANSIFAKTFNIETPDFMGFVKSLSDISATMPDDQFSASATNIDMSKVQQKWDPIYQELRAAIAAAASSQTENVPAEALPIQSASGFDPSDIQGRESYTDYTNGQMSTKVEITPDGRICFYDYSRYTKDGEDYIAINKFDGKNITIILVKKIKIQNHILIKIENIK